MAIFDLYLGIDSEYIKLLQDIYKAIVILIVFQVLVFNLNASKNIINTALTGAIMNDEFMTLLLCVIISIGAYYLVFDKVLSIN
jgi:hypothetical protein